MDDEDMALLVDLHIRQQRQGPGGEEETGQAIALANLQKSERLRIADIGCGTGASAMQLAQSLDAEITAVDFLPEFVDVLKKNAEAKGLGDKINTLVCAMEELPFDDAEFDVIWSEGAIYNMGFENGVNAWKRFLKPGGILVASEITWITGTRPAEIEEYWAIEYPEIATASTKIKVLEQSGYKPVGYFVLAERCWLENYYGPVHDQISDFLVRHEGNEKATQIIEAEREELALYEKYNAFYSYGMYLAQKLPAQ